MKRARSGSNLTDKQAENTQVKTATTREASREPKRPPRVSMTSGLKLDYANKDPNYHYAWIQDRDGQVDRAIQAYYDFELVNGEKVTRASGPYPLFLMKLEMKYWEEDQRLKHKQTVGKLQGEQTIERGGPVPEYLPGAEDGRKHVLEKDDYDPLA